MIAVVAGQPVSAGKKRLRSARNHGPEPASAREVRDGNLAGSGSERGIEMADGKAAFHRARWARISAWAAFRTSPALSAHSP
jgi:hypothetical protein